MLEIEIDGKKLTVPDGSTIMDAANSIGTHIPHFCYHKKLSIAANCRMCLVQVEKAPKPLPACATPVTDGMKVFTHSDLAVKAQKGVMEFLLINHPLDCPICDQGGECQLQDLAVGYGKSESRYEEEKRVVPNKDLGPLISTDMTRCIHCTRCVRFTEEIAGNQELGGAHRGEHTEIMPFIAKTVDSEISGNVIDLCPVGALTSKPFRYSARTWELSRRKSIAAHDGMGANVIVQVKSNQVMRVLPNENDSINECWLSDRDRFSYEALNSADRLTQPMVKQGNEWQASDWAAALDYVAHGLKDIVARHGADQVAFVAGKNATTEELYLFKTLATDLGINTTDTALRVADGRLAGNLHGGLWLGQSITELLGREAILVVGANLRKEQPLLTQRIRQAVKKGMALTVINAADDALHIPLAAKSIITPAQWAEELSGVVKAVALGKGVDVPAEVADVAVSAQAQQIADVVMKSSSCSILLGELAQNHVQAAELLQAANLLNGVSGSVVGVLTPGANSAGAAVVGFVPAGAKNTAATAFAEPKKAYVLLNVEPELDAANGVQAVSALQQAALVVSLTSFKGENLKYSDAVLPVAPATETAGSFINFEGKLQTFNGVVKPLGETRPAWKVFRVLGNVLNLPGYEFNSVEEVRSAAVGNQTAFANGKLTNTLKNAVEVTAAQVGTYRLGEVGIYQVDGLTRRAASLQQTKDANPAFLAANSRYLAAIGATAGDRLVVEQSGLKAELIVTEDNALADNVVRVPVGFVETSGLGNLVGPAQVNKA